MVEGLLYLLWFVCSKEKKILYAYYVDGSTLIRAALLKGVDMYCDYKLSPLSIKYWQSHVCTRLEYGSIKWNPWYKNDTIVLENVQRKFIKIMYMFTGT